MGNIQMLGKSDDCQIKAEAPNPFGFGPSSAFGAVASRALDFWLAGEDRDNFHVVGGGFTPSIGAVNPTQAIIVNTLRVADRITELIP